jgi:predicted Zn-dependent protease with MMP-like domain
MTAAMPAQQPRSREEFETVAQEVWDALPEHFREIVGNLSIQIEDFAQPDTLDHLGIRSPYGLLGLYHGLGAAVQKRLGHAAWAGHDLPLPDPDPRFRACRD